jgi:post-segregation antitoxin (ccd killing protein)
MRISDLVELAQNRLLALQRSRQNAWDAGNAQAVSDLDSEISDTQATLNQLQTLAG